MTIYTFEITEYSLAGTKMREIEIQARTEKSALKKLLDIKGNRDWSWILKNARIDNPSKKGR